MSFEVILFLAIVICFGIAALTGAPYVPSQKKEIKIALTELYPIGKEDLLIDLGSGDGVVLKEATRHGAKAIGIEINPVMVYVSRLRLLKNKNTKVIQKNFYNFEFPKETTVIYLFGVSRDLGKIYNKIEFEAKRLNKTLYVISYGFEFNNIKPTKKVRAFFLYKVF